MAQTCSGNGTVVPASVMLQKVHDQAPAGHVTLEWLMGCLGQQSFGMIVLILAVLAAAPGISVVAGLLLLLPALQMILGRPQPQFPTWIASCKLPTQRMGAVVQRAIPILARLEGMIYPRFPTPPETTKRIVGAFILMLTVRLLLMPIPLSNILPAVLIAIISLAYLEHDGLLLLIGLLIGSLVLVLDFDIVWQLAHDAKWIIKLLL